MELNQPASADNPQISQNNNQAPPPPNSPKVVQKAVTKSELNTDQLTDLKTIYNVSAFEIFWRNFLAGISRALGSLILYAVILTILGFVFTQYLLPTIQPLIDQYQDALNSITEMNQIQKDLLDPEDPSPQTPSINLDQLLQQLQGEPTTR